MKKYMIGMLMAVFVFIAVLPQQAFAADEKESILLEKLDDKSASVKLRLPNAAGEQIVSIQLSLVMSGGTGVSPEFEFDATVKERATVYESPYDKTKKTMNIYISGSEPLYRENEVTLTLGRLSVAKDLVTVRAQDVRIVRGMDVEKLDIPSEDIELRAPSSDKNDNNNNGNSGILTGSVKKPEIQKAVNVAGGITIKWKKVKNATGYYVYRKTGAGKRYSKIATVKTLRYTDTSVRSKNGIKYRYTVQAYNSAKKSKNANSIQIVRLTTPKLYRPRAKGSGKMLVRWKQDKKATGYQIQYSRSKKFDKRWIKHTVRSKKITARTISRLTQDKDYYVRIRMYKKVGKKAYFSAWGDAKKVRIR